MTEEQLKNMEASAPLLVDAYRKLQAHHRDVAARIFVRLMGQVNEYITAKAIAEIMTEFVWK